MMNIPAGATTPLDSANIPLFVKSLQANNIRSIALLCAARDDLGDGGSAFVVETIRAIRSLRNRTFIELHICDFGGSRRALRDVLAARPDLLHHSVVTSPRFYTKFAPGFDYVRSLEILRIAKEEHETIRTRSSLAIGLGENRDDLVAALADLRSVRVDEIFLVPAQPQRKPLPPTDALEKVKIVAGKLGFDTFEILTAPRTCAAVER